MAKNTKRAAPARPWTKNGKAQAEAKEGLRIMSGREAIKENATEAAQARKDFKPPQVPPLPGMTPLGMKPAEAKATAAEAKLAKAEAERERNAKMSAEVRKARAEAGPVIHTRKPEAKKAAAKADRPAKAPKAKGEKPLSRRAQIAADAEAGKLPPAPDWSKRTHYRAQYAELVSLVKEGNVRALEKLELPTTITQLSRYRDLAVIALKAKKGSKPAQAARMSTARRYAR